MALQSKYQNNAQPLLTEQVEATSLRAQLLAHKMTALRRGILLPDVFIAELEDFALRNSISECSSANKEEISFNERGPCYCERCLKAFALHHGREHGLTKEALSFIDALFNVEAGHHGYYLDDDELISLSSFSLSLKDVARA